jgi:hypothetical protein
MQIVRDVDVAMCRYLVTGCRYVQVLVAKYLQKKNPLKNPLLMYSTIKFETASKATPQGRRLYRAGVGFELSIKRSPARRLDHSATTSLST